MGILKIRNSLLVSIVCLIAVLVIVTGCGCRAPTAQPVPPPPGTSNTPGPAATASVPPAASPSLSPPSAVEQIVERARSGLSSISGYYLERTVSNVKTIQGANAGTASTDVFSKMTLDISGRKMQMNNVINFKTSSGTFSMPVLENTIFVIGDTIYIQGLIEDNQQMWTKSGLPPGYLQTQNQAQMLVDLLPASSSMVLTPEIIRSANEETACDVLETTPDLKAFWDLMVTQPAVQLPLEAPSGVAYSQFIKIAEMKTWLSQSNGIPVKAALRISLQMGPDIVPALTNKTAQEITVSMLFKNYNRISAIELPPEAKGAPDLSNLKTQTPTK